MPLTNAQTRHLRGLAHALRPVVMVGQGGLGDSVLAEIEQALTRHELLKIKLSLGDRTLRDEAVAAIVEATGAETVQRIGNTLVLYRRNPEKPRITLP